jgi:hypothetical protein
MSVPDMLREGLTSTIAWFEQNYHASLAVPV